MIRLFGTTDTVFDSNGDLVIRPIKARVHKEDNGAFYLDLETDLSYVDELTAGRILVANTPQGDQAFRISNVTKTRSKITLRAEHVFFDSRNYLIADTFIVDKDCVAALQQLLDHTEPTTDFTCISDIGTVDSYRCVRTSLHDAIGMILERWGGHLDLDNFEIGIRAEIGQDNGVTVRYAKNLKEIQCEEDWSEVVTKLLPVGNDGILLNDIDPSASIYVTSETQYDNPFVKCITFMQDIAQEDYDTEQAYHQAVVDDLRQQAQAYVDAYSLPHVNYTLRANLEKLTDIGDTVEVIDDRLGISLLTNVISFDYDCILEKYVEVEFGNFKKELSGLMGQITAQVETTTTQKTNEVKVTLSEELHQATAQIWATMGSSYVIYNGDSIMVVDSLPADTATNVILINNGGIGFSQTGINGTFNSAWTIDGTLNMQNINVINLVADLIQGGTLTLGNNLNESGILELYDEQNNLIGRMDKDGLKMYGTDGSYVVMNNDVGFAGYDRNNVKQFWVDRDEFHMEKAVIENEITLCNELRFIPITIYSGSTIVNEGIGLVSAYTGGN